MKTNKILQKILSALLPMALMVALVIGCEMSSDFSGSDTGQGGSLNRFTVVGDYLYVVDNEDLTVFNVSVPEAPEQKSEINIGSEIETLFPANNMLFIGSRSGMYIYGLTNPEKPEKLSVTTHVYNCDPVVADSRYAYVTLRDGNSCRGWQNELQIVDILDPKNTKVVKKYDMDRPKGLGIKGGMLFVCDEDEIKVYDKSGTPDLEELYEINISANDVIVLDSILLVITDRALYEYSYTYNSHELLSQVYSVNE